MLRPHIAGAQTPSAAPRRSRAVTLRNGRNGYAGVLNEKTFASPDAAERFANAQRRAKIGKGYVPRSPPRAFWDGAAGGKHAAPLGSSRDREEDGDEPAPPKRRPPARAKAGVAAAGARRKGARAAKRAAPEEEEDDEEEEEEARPAPARRRVARKPALAKPAAKRAKKAAASGGSDEEHEQPEASDPDEATAAAAAARPRRAMKTQSDAKGPGARPKSAAARRRVEAAEARAAARLAAKAEAEEAAGETAARAVRAASAPTVPAVDTSVTGARSSAGGVSAFMKRPDSGEWWSVRLPSGASVEVVIRQGAETGRGSARRLVLGSREEAFAAAVGEAKAAAKRGLVPAVPAPHFWKGGPGRGVVLRVAVEQLRREAESGSDEEDSD